MVMETHHVQTRFGPVVIRVYRLREGWWPVAVGGLRQLPAQPTIEDPQLSQSVEVAVQRMVEVIDSLRPRLHRSAVG